MHFIMTVLITFLSTALFGIVPVFSADNGEIIAQAPRITKEKLRPLLGSPELVVIDVRQPKDWDGSPSKIKGAVRMDPTQGSSAVTDKLPKDKTIVFYCT